MARLLTKALLAGLAGLFVGPLAGLVLVFGLMMFDRNAAPAIPAAAPWA